MRAIAFQLFVTILVFTAGASAQEVDKAASQLAKKLGQQASEHGSDTMTQPQPGPEMEKLVKTFAEISGYVVRQRQSARLHCYEVWGQVGRQPSGS